MKITHVTVRFGVTANLGNFNNSKVEVELTAEIAVGENDEFIRVQLMESAKEQVYETVRSIKGRKAAREDLL